MLFGHPDQWRRIMKNGTQVASSRAGRICLPVIGVVVVIALWQVFAMSGVLPKKTVPTAVQVGQELMHEFTSGGFWGACGQTLTTWAIGVGISIALAIPLGLLIGSVEPAWRALRPTLEFLRPVPGIAIIPVVVLTWGPTPTSAVVLIVFGCVWLLTIQTMYGVREVDDVARQTAKAYSLSRLERIRSLILPSALPFIATGVRLITALALVVAITAELLIGSPGLGNEMGLAETGGNNPLLYCLVVVSGALGVIVYLIFRQLERLFLGWHQSHRPEVA
jgi:ABC-type nitrate/sulfonate/bicarbonate transport system permease component